MKIIEIRSNGTKRVATVNTEPSKTDQSQAKACDVNNIIAKYKKTGQLTHLKSKQGTYADLSEVTDLLGALTTVQKAQEAFETLPASLRKKLNNDPVRFIEYLKDPKNDEEAIKLGLKVKKASDTVPSVEEPSVSAVVKSADEKK